MSPLRNRDQLAALIADFDRLREEKVKTLRAAGDCAGDEQEAHRLTNTGTLLGEHQILAALEIVEIVREELKRGRCVVHGSQKIAGCCGEESVS